MFLQQRFEIIDTPFLRHQIYIIITAPSIQLSSGYDFPLIGYGTFGGSDGPSQVYTGTKHALESGYRHFDTAYLCKSCLFHAPQ